MHHGQQENVVNICFCCHLCENHVRWKHRQ